MPRPGGAAIRDRQLRPVGRPARRIPVSDDFATLAVEILHADVRQVCAGRFPIGSGAEESPMYAAVRRYEGITDDAEAGRLVPCVLVFPTQSPARTT